jgi:hypothetical protein
MRKVTISLFCCLVGLQPLLAADVPAADPRRAGASLPPAGGSISSRAKDAQVSFRRDVVPVFSNCTMCHQDALPMGGLSLTPESAYAQLVNVKAIEADRDRVEPRHPEKSYLLDKVTGRNALVKGGGVGMPMGQAPLLSAEADLIRRWIQQGAKNN